ncbi:MAG: carboxylating nicotinate-nucleotide diphosphorylase [Candidatus Melainabacteria bacterium]|nr:carboxylating nicotinate-nucleotide diphosphorylase [Candidatus Melainabacteria bacterium]
MTVFTANEYRKQLERHPLAGSTTSTVISAPDSIHSTELAQKAIEFALLEDLGQEGDVTSNSTIPETKQATASLIAKDQNSVICGLAVAEMVFKMVDPRLEFNALVEEGIYLEKAPVTVATIEGNARSILTAERTALNLMQRMSGIATSTRLYVQKAKPYGIEILDTRKTAPGLRVFDKLAVRLGGGTNHRIGLYDQILIKDNHIACAGSIKKAVAAARCLYRGKRIEVETTSLSEVQEALDSSCDIIMLDNMTPAEIASCIDLVRKEAQIEVSGGITLETLDSYLIAGVDFISVGSLTHSVKSIDISLEVEIGI